MNQIQGILRGENLFVGDQNVNVNKESMVYESVCGDNGYGIKNKTWESAEIYFRFCRLMWSYNSRDDY